MNKYYLVWLLLLIQSSLIAKIYTVSITVKGLPRSTVLLTDFYGNRNQKVDSAISDNNGNVIFNFPEGRKIGMYKIVCGDDKYLDFIFNHENCVFETKLADIQSNIKVIESNENQLYFNFLKNYKLIKEKLNALQQLSQYYDLNDPFYKQIAQEYSNKAKEVTEFVDIVENNNPQSYALKIIKSKIEYFPEIGVSPYNASLSVRSHWFDNVDFKDTSLLYSNVFTTKAIGYLQLYASKYYNQEQQTMVFKTAIDSLLERSKANSKVYNQMVDFLISGFEDMGGIKLVEHVANRYSNQNSCEHEGNKTTLERKVLSYTKLKIGSDAPNFSFKSENGTTVTLDNYSNNTVILLFWATWCPHCQELLPEVKKIFDTRIDKTCDLLSISLDTNRVEWSQFIKTKSFNTWKNMCDVKSWDGDMAKDYYTYASPTIFIIKNKKIIGKPLDLDSFKEILRSENILK